MGFFMKAVGLICCLLAYSSTVHGRPSAPLEARNDSPSDSNTITFNTNILRGRNIFHQQHKDAKLVFVQAIPNEAGAEVSVAEDLQRIALIYTSENLYWSQSSGPTWGTWGDIMSKPDPQKFSFFDPTKIQYSATEAISIGQPSVWRAANVKRLSIMPRAIPPQEEREGQPFYFIEYHTANVSVNAVTGEIGTWSGVLDFPIVNDAPTIGDNKTTDGGREYSRPYIGAKTGHSFQ